MKLGNGKEAINSNDIEAEESIVDKAENNGAPLPEITASSIHRDLSRRSKQERVKKAAYESLVESLVALGYSFLAAPFVASDMSWIKSPFVTSTFLMLINFLLRIPDPDNADNHRHLRVIRSGIFALMDNRTRDLILHEFGHAFAVFSFFNATPTVEIRPDFITWTGNTHYADHELTALGAKLGWANSKLAVSAAGVGLSTLWNSGSIIAAHAVKNAEIKLHLRMLVLLSFLDEIIYASLSYMTNCNKNKNDFCQLKEHNISPIVVILVTTAMMMALQFFLHCFNKCYFRASSEEQAEHKLNSRSFF